MNIGWHDICLRCTDLQASRAFYEALGMEVVHDGGNWVHLTNGNLHISLMTFLDANWINFRGADVNAVFEAVKSSGVPAEGTPERYTRDEMGSDGTHWTTRDPEGNVVYFDTTSEEEPTSRQVGFLLDDIERVLARAGIESTTFETFRDELTAKYG